MPCPLAREDTGDIFVGFIENQMTAAWDLDCLID
jgi:hypothetical protein